MNCSLVTFLAQIQSSPFADPFNTSPHVIGHAITGYGQAIPLTNRSAGSVYGVRGADGQNARITGQWVLCGNRWAIEVNRVEPFFGGPVW